MSPILLSILMFIVATVLVMVGTVWIVRFYIGRTIVRTHETLEHIVETGQIPESWHENKQDSVRVMRKLNKLNHYVRKTRLVDSEETRAHLLARIEAASSKVRKE